MRLLVSILAICSLGHEKSYEYLNFFMNRLIGKKVRVRNILVHENPANRKINSYTAATWVCFQ